MAVSTLIQFPQCKSGGEHELTARRFRSTKVRKQCVKCLLWTGWLPATTVTDAEAEADELSLSLDAEHRDEQPTFTRASLSNALVGDLRSMAKDRGITGYSKMKKAELIDLLGT